MNTTALLTERGHTHGDFTMNALYGQELRAMFRRTSGWASMPAVQKEALDMIATKVSRILSGQSTHDDHWNDIAGYATLALEACSRDAR